MVKTNAQRAIDDFQFLVKKTGNYFKGVTVSSEFSHYTRSLLNDWATNDSDHRFIKYKRETVVYVDFGLNIGAELSGPHYAIILDKNDNPTSAKVTVVPLTSKEGTFNVPLPTGLNKIFGAWYALVGLEHTNEFPSQNEAVALLFQVIGEKSTNKESKTENAFMKRINKYQSENDLIKRRLKKQMDDLEKISYFKIDNVATISKYRIKKRKDRFDPLGTIIVPGPDMDLIDKQVVQHILDN